MKMLYSLLLLAPFLTYGQTSSEPRFEEAQTAARKWQLSEGLQIEVFAAEPQLQNPVSFSVDEKGRVYVAETHRFLQSVFDITHHTNWLMSDLGFRKDWNRAPPRANSRVHHLSKPAFISRVRKCDRHSEGGNNCGWFDKRKKRSSAGA